MSDYQKLMESTEYAEFLKEHTDYAFIFGYDLTTEKGVKSAMFDEFLFTNFLQEKVGV